MNMLTTTTSKTATMSSLEIAELTGKRHDNVVRDIREMLEASGEVALNFEGNYKALNGKTNPCFHLPKDLTITLVAGYDVPLRLKIVRRWMELEEAEFNRARHAIPQTFAQALQLAADQAIQIEQQEARLVIAEPKAALVS